LVLAYEDFRSGARMKSRRVTKIIRTDHEYAS
jgi:hypothetical protein